MVIQKLLFSRFKNRTQKNWKSQLIAPHLADEYSHLRDEIERCYTHVTHWHGTGRYHYATKGKSKYEFVDPNTITDVLEQILLEKGLKPHDDPWVKVNHLYNSSVSTSQMRMYARTYAELHMPEKKTISPVYGQRKEIINFLFWYTMLSAPLLPIFKSIKTAFHKTYAKKGPVWAVTVNNTLKSKGNAFADLLYIMGECSSNIEKNYGILIGLDLHEYTAADINPMIGLFEARFTHLIPLQNITHFEVPLALVSEVKKFLEKHNINIPVFPIEICELYCADRQFFFLNNSVLPYVKREELIEHYKHGGAQ